MCEDRVDHWHTKFREAQKEIEQIKKVCNELDLMYRDLVEETRTLHQIVYGSVSDSVWEIDPKCDHDNMPWPCPTILLLGDRYKD